STPSDGGPNKPSGSGGDPGAGGNPSAGGPSTGGLSGTPSALGLDVSPNTAITVTGGTVQFTVTANGTANAAVTSAIEETGTDGSIDDTGLFTAPTQPGVYHVTAVSNSDSTLTDRSTVTVSKPATGEPGTWETVTPSGLSLDPDFHAPHDNFGT